MPETTTRQSSGVTITIAVFLLCSILTAMSRSLPQRQPPVTETPASDTVMSDAAEDDTVWLPSAEDPLLLLVNREHPLPEGYSVYTVPLEDFSQSVAAAAYDDLCAMLSDGEKEGLSFMVCSGYRTTQTQKQLFDEDVQKLMDDGLSYEAAYRETAQFTMPPGCSEHETGLALDIVSMEQQMLDEHQARTAETQWLHAHCWEYGFILRYPEDRSEITGIDYEPWHYRYVGREAAAHLTQQGLTLEEFHAQ